MTQQIVPPGPELPGLALSQTPFTEQPQVAYLQSAPVSEQEGAVKSGSHGKDMLLNGMATAAVAADLPVINEVLRGSVLAASELYAHNPYVTTIATTAATLAIEAGGAVGVARLLATEKGHRAIGWVHKKLGKIGLKKGQDTDIVTDAAVAFTTGVAAMTVVKQEVNPTRTKESNVHHGLRMAAGITAASAPVSYLIAEGAHDVSPLKVGAAAVAVAGLFAASKKIKAWAGIHNVPAKQDRMVVSRDASVAEAFVPATEKRYDLDDAELSVIERRLIDYAKNRHPNTVTAMWLRGDSDEANFVRTHEKRKFEGINIEDLFKDSDDQSTFMVLVDARRSAGAGRVIRGTRITGKQYAKDVPADERGASGMAMIQDMVNDGEISMGEISAYYEAEGIDLTACISVETNFKIGERARRRAGVIPMSQLAYLAIYRYVVGRNPRRTDAAIFAHSNQATINSLQRLGVDIGPVAGRPDLRTPAGPNVGTRYDDKFSPTALLNTPRTTTTMRRLMKFAPREMYI